MPTKILLTGIGGFIGAHLLQHILEHTKWHVVGIESWRHKGTPERVDEVLKSNPEWRARVTIITHDLIAPFPERTANRIGRCEYIVNVASESHVDRSIDDPVPFIQNNVNLMLTMLEFARKFPPKAFLQVSTDEVYGAAPEGVNHEEWSAIIPSNPYSASKAAQEAIAISYWRTYGVPVIITNTMNNYGEMQDAEKYIAKLIRGIQKGSTVTIHGNESKAVYGSRYYLHARNHADAILFLLRKTMPSNYFEGINDRPDRYNVVGDTELDNMDMAELIAELIGNPLHYEVVDFHKARAGHDRRYALDGSKLASLGWTPPVPFKESLERYIKWTLKDENALWR